MNIRKRGQGLTMTTIVIAAIAVIVFIVLVAVFGGRLGLFQWRVRQAENETQQATCGIGNCVPSADQCPSDTTPDETGNYIDCDMVCCK